MKKKFGCIIMILAIVYFCLSVLINNNVYAETNNNLTNATRIYFCAGVTKNYGNADCILLENYDAEGNKIYGLIDAGRMIEKEDQDGNTSTVVKEFLKEHGVKKLDFFVLTHSHADHNGDALTVLENFDVEKIYMKEFDEKWSTTGTQSTYESIIQKAIEKNIEIVGINPLSLKSKDISPSMSDEFMKSVENVDETLFEAFDDDNVTFNFGSAAIKIFNWEMFDESGKRYITGETTDATREIVASENNNSLGVLLTQGNKKAFFAGDINNSDEDTKKGRVGDEDRIKDDIGKIDFLKLGHHGCEHSNTESYLDVLSPEYAVITSDEGGAYKETAKWLEENNVDYLYTTIDEKGIIATITNDDVYLGFETTGVFKNIDDTLYYIPENEDYAHVNYKDAIYKVEYQDKSIEVDSWNKLKEEVDQNKNEEVNIDADNKVCKIHRLIVNLKSSGNWIANEEIVIDERQNVILTTSENITMTRGTKLIKQPLFLVNGNFSIGTEQLDGTITLDGNKSNVEASSTLLRVESGTLNLYNNVVLCNNMNKTKERTKNATTQDYTSFGSAIYANFGNINMYGGEIRENSQDVDTTYIIQKDTGVSYRFSTFGTGIYMTNNSTLNMHNGKIKNNDAQNHSIVKTNEGHANAKDGTSVMQTCQGIGIYADLNSKVNLYGGEISENSATNNSKLKLVSPTDAEKSYIYSASCNIYGVGMYISGADVKMTNNFLISNNTAKLNAEFNLENNTWIKSNANSGIRGVQAFCTDAEINIDSAEVSTSNMKNNTTITNNGAIGAKGDGTVSVSNYGGGLIIVNCNSFNINNLNINECNSENGAGLYIQSSSGTISNSTFENNISSNLGGGIYIRLSDTEINNTTINNNQAMHGGGIYVSGETSNTRLNNLTVTNNKAVGGNGAGIYAFGELTISGDNTLISSNNTNKNGGGIYVKNNCILNDGQIIDNVASGGSGGGIRVDGTLTMNNGTIKNNSAKTYGGGIYYGNGSKNAQFIFYGGKIKDNKAEGDGNEIYPEPENDIIDPTVKISEIPSIWTNEDIVVNITAEDKSGIKSVRVREEELQLENDTYNYTVTENGTYTVTVIDNADNECTSEFTVACIDKIAPEVTGVTDNTTYEEGQIVNANDELSGIKKVKLTKNDKEVAYGLGNKIEEEGNYVLTVEDNAGNKTVVKFVIDIDDSPVDEYILGDINKDKNITITDLVLLRRHLIAETKANWKLSNEQQSLADLNQDGNISITDLVMLRRILLRNN